MNRAPNHPFLPRTGVTMQRRETFGVLSMLSMFAMLAMFAMLSMLALVQHTSRAVCQVYVGHVISQEKCCANWHWRNEK